MHWIVTAEEMRVLDSATIDELGIPSLVLMENAGRAVAREAAAMLAGSERRVVGLVGVGNNGADVVVAARTLAGRGVSVEVWLVGSSDRRSPELRTQLEIAERLKIPLRTLADGQLSAFEAALDAGGVVLDGLFGTGLKRPVEGLWARAIEAVNARPIPTLAVDIASGLDANRGGVLGAAIQADRTLCLQLPKLGQLLYPGRAHSGALRVADIGIPSPPQLGYRPAATWLGPELLTALAAPRAPDTHKGSFGRLLVLAGQPDQPGAALLAGRAGLAAGAGLVTLGSDRRTIRRLAPALGPLMGRSLGEERAHERWAMGAAERADAVVVGPSLPPDGGTKALVTAMAELQRPALFDAGALSALALDRAPLLRRLAPTVLTPHPGEAGLMLGLSPNEVQADRPSAARRLAEQTGAEVVLKGASSLVASPDGALAVVLAGNPGMATAGSGDVLSGVIGALLAEGMDAATAARAGALWHARAGDLAAAHRGQRGLTADALLDALPEALTAPFDPIPAQR